MDGEAPRTPDRDRDDDGRARNARGRDALGRPLPYGETGVPPLPEGLVLAPEEALAEAQRLLDDGLPFQAHEMLEIAWKSAPGSQRALWQGLAQLAVGLTHARRGNLTGAATVLRRGRDGIAPYAAGAPYGIDVDGLVVWADLLLAELAVAVDDGRDVGVTSPELRRR